MCVYYLLEIGSAFYEMAKCDQVSGWYHLHRQWTGVSPFGDADNCTLT